MMTVWSLDDVTAAQGGEADSAVLRLPVVLLPGIRGAVGEPRALRLGEITSPSFEGRAGRCIDLHAVMHLEDFDVGSCCPATLPPAPAV